MLIVEIDSRESKDNIVTYGSVIEIVLNDNVEINVKALDEGDIIFYTDDYEFILICEIKHENDFIASIIDGRLKGQSNRLVEYENKAILITGDYDFDVIDMNPSAVYGAEAGLRALGFHIINDFDIEVGIEKLTRLAFKLEQYKGGVKLTNIQIKKSNPVETFLLSIKGLKLTTVDNIVSQLGLKTLQDLFELTEEKLVTVDRIGEIKAGYIIKNIKGDYDG